MEAPAASASTAAEVPVSNDGVVQLSPFTHETCRLSDDRGEGIAAVRHRDDAVDAAKIQKSHGGTHLGRI